MSTPKAPVATFLGAARTVTGSKTLIDGGNGRILVDCGLFQGRKALRQANWAPFPVAPESIDAVVLTHAHVDHCGFVPRLHRLGYRGPVYCTHGTRDLAAIVLPDSGHLHEEEANYANRKGYSKHSPAEPLYTEADAMSALELFQPVAFGEVLPVADVASVRWQRAGHILGAASLHLDLAGGPDVVFSGDLGRPSHPLLRPPDPVGSADVLVVESTYGDEEHPPDDPLDVIAEVVNDAAASGGVVIVPAFAVDRTEVVLWYLDQLVASGRVPDIPVVLDSPMASRALEVYRAEVRRGSPEFRQELSGTELFASLSLTETRSVDDSKGLNERHGPFIIVSASGMLTGGRVVHHLANRVRDSRTTVLLVGFQAPGTRGDRLRQGARTLKMLGSYHPVGARVVTVGLSTHADRSELIDWTASAQGARLALVNHGEESAAQALVDGIEARGLAAAAPFGGERVLLAR